jgi:hypothetical protein
MSKIAIITSTGTAQADRIFKGVYGAVGQSGQFEVAPELKKIYLFTLLTPEALKQQGIDLSDSLAEIEIAPEHEVALKATLANNLASQWDKTYESALAGMSNGAAVESERASVSSSVVAMLAEYAVPQQVVTLDLAFKNVAGQLDYSDESGEINGANTSASTIASASGNNWTPALQQSVLTDLHSVSQTADAQTTFVSGVLVNEVSIHAQDEEQKNAVLAALLTLPENLIDRVINPANARILQVEWHAFHNFEAHTPTVETAGEAAVRDTATFPFPVSEEGRAAYRQTFGVNAPVSLAASYQELLAFKEAHGHSNQATVPDRSELFQWVQAQRAQRQSIQSNHESDECGSDASVIPSHKAKSGFW